MLKMFMPETRRAIGGSPQDRLVSGYLIAAFQSDLIKLRPPSKRFDLLNVIAQIPVMNFPWLVSYSAFDGEAVDQRFMDGISALLSALPSDRIGWETRFGDDIFSARSGERLFSIVHYLRKVDRL
ncbi:hypothetical protein [Croceicoccus mobilis]|uniref:hypothetical protein n=1 Tax=Croceicoccus mobilis TaxID=1703339 RepID=UPI0012E96088|nr:hypothetical protein [Croceicoccus mobilis]